MTTVPRPISGNQMKCYRFSIGASHLIRFEQVLRRADLSEFAKGKLRRDKPRALFALGTTLLILTLVAPASFAQEHKGPATVSELQTKLAELVGQQKFAPALWGIKIVSLDTTKTLFETNSE